MNVLYLTNKNKKIRMKLLNLMKKNGGKVFISYKKKLKNFLKIKKLSLLYLIDIDTKWILL